jgi:hypothetical protein
MVQNGARPSVSDPAVGLPEAHGDPASFSSVIERGLSSLDPVRPRSALPISFEPGPSATTPGSPLVDEIVFSTPAELSLGEGLATELAGLFFLVPFLRSLGFPAILESEFGVERSLGGWALLELVGKSLLGPMNAALAKDPAWKALRLLDGRRDLDPPGADFAGCRVYRLPACWHVVSAQDVVPHFGSHGCVVRHSLGFALAVWQTDEQLSRLQVCRSVAGFCQGRVVLGPLGRRECRRRASRLSRPASIDCGSNLPLLRFLRFVLPYLRWRLGVALARDKARPLRSFANFIRRAGRLYVTSTHVDLVMDLRHVDTAVRLAGLDANPGWVPEFGRVITFHYR